jgi:hypothetical protein
MCQINGDLSNEVPSFLRLIRHAYLGHKHARDGRTGEIRQGACEHRFEPELGDLSPARRNEAAEAAE